jgi:hypothetical protein
VSLATFFEYDATKLINGQARVLYSKLKNGSLTDTPVPADISKIFLMDSPYTPYSAGSLYSPWVAIGATAAPITYDRGVTAVDWKIQQILTPVLIVPQEITRTFKVPIAEAARADLIQLFENGPAQNSIAGATGISAQQQQQIGQFTDLTQYRFAVAMFQPLEAGVVTEQSGGTRPRLVVHYLNRCSLMAENVTVNYGQAEMVNFDLTVKAYPEPGQPQNAEYGGFFFEAAGTIA